MNWSANSCSEEERDGWEVALCNASCIAMAKRLESNKANIVLHLHPKGKLLFASVEVLPKALLRETSCKGSPKENAMPLEKSKTTPSEKKEEIVVVTTTQGDKTEEPKTTSTPSVRVPTSPTETVDIDKHSKSQKGLTMMLYLIIIGYFMIMSL
jgi:hypothetical protein